MGSLLSGRPYASRHMALVKKRSLGVLLPLRSAIFSPAGCDKTGTGTMPETSRHGCRRFRGGPIRLPQPFTKEVRPLDMSSETAFRVAVVIVAVLNAAVVASFRWRAASGERVSRRGEGLVLAVTLRLLAAVLWFSLLAWLFRPDSVRWAALEIPVVVRWAAVVPGLMCAGLMFWTLSSLGRNLTDTVFVRASACLVVRGPYRWVRHPFYVVTALLMTCVTIISANWLIGLGSFSVLAMLALRTPREEQQLVARFGVEYQDYMARTGRYIPRWRQRRAGVRADS